MGRSDRAAWIVSLLPATALFAACLLPTTPATPASQLVPQATPTAAPSPTVVASPFPTPVATASPVPSVVPSPTPNQGAFVEAVIASRVFRLELARSPGERARGLMDRPELPEGAGMLFVYEQEDYLTFWMKNTLIALDILFLDSQKVVVDVQSMYPQPGAPDALLARYRSASPAQYAIEINVGSAQRYGIAPGMQVEWR